METIALDSGRLSFVVRTPDGDKPWNPDVMELKLVSEELEAKHKLEEVDGQVKSTGPFLLELADAFERLGCPQCDSAQALRVWAVVTHRALEIIDSLNQQLGS